ncbi:MAG: T9SS type A sorting domain-containing protein [Candidatus Kapaibacterium sp.]
MKTLFCLLLLTCAPLAAQDYLVWSKRYDYNVHDVRYSPDEKTVAVAHGDSISILSVDDGRTLRTIGTRPERFQIEQVIFAPDGNSVIVRYEEKKLIDEWNVNDGTLRESYLKDYQNVPTIKWLNHIDISPDGKHFAATFNDGSSNCIFVVIDRETGKELYHKEGKEYGEVKYSHNSGILALVRYSPYPRIELYDTKDYSMWSNSLDQPGTAKMVIKDIDFSYNDSLLAVVTWGYDQINHAIWLVDMKTKNITKPISTSGTPDVQRIKFYTDSIHLFAGINGISFRAYSTQQPSSPYIFKDPFALWGGAKGIDCARKDGGTIATSGLDVVMYNNKWKSVVSVEENNVKPDSVLYPNPTNDQVTIRTSYLSIVPISLSIIDIIGKQYPLVANTSWEGNNYLVSFNVGILPTGKYYVRLQGDNNSRTFTFIRE